MENYSLKEMKRFNYLFGETETAYHEAYLKLTEQFLIDFKKKLRSYKKWTFNYLITLIIGNFYLLLYHLSL